MAKKMMKRSLALGALMAFAITGSAMAADYTMSGDKIHNVSEMITGENTLSGSGTLTINNGIAQNHVIMDSKLTVKGVDLVINSAVTGESDWGVLRNATINSDSKITINQTGKDAAIGYMAANDNITAAELNIVSKGASAIYSNGDDVKVLDADKITLESTFVDGTSTAGTFLAENAQLTIKDFNELTSNTYTEVTNDGGYGFMSTGNSTIVITGREDSTVKVYSEGMAALGAINNGSTTVTASTVELSEDKFRDSDEARKSGVVAVQDSGQLTINVDKKLTIEDKQNREGENATNAIKVTGGNFVLNNTQEAVVEIKGDITQTAGSMTLELKNAESSLNGTINTATEDAKISFSNGATWTNNGASNVKNLTVDGGIIDQNSGENIVIGNLSGDATVKFSANGKVLVGASDGSVTNTDANKVGQFGVKDKEIDAKVVVEESAVLGEGYTDVEYEESAKDGYFMGKLGETNYKANTTNTGIADMAALGLAAWRADNGTLMKRMGELRNANGEQGTWARMTRTESEYGVANMQGNTYSVGYDQKVANDWTVGAAITYKDASASSTKGSADIEQKGIAFYGTKLNENGTYIDVVAKYTNLDNDYTVNGGIGSGDYDAGAYSLSAEYGKRFTQDNGFWVEPQAELTYGHVGSASYTTAAGKAAQASFDSFVGRVGVLVGKDVAAGNVYAKASYLYDFDGEASMTFRDAKDKSIFQTYEDDLGGGWFEVGVGTNINLSKATYVYADVEKTFSGDVDTKWQWNLGVRYSF